MASNLRLLALARHHRIPSALAVRAFHHLVRPVAFSPSSSSFPAPSSASPSVNSPHQALPHSLRARLADRWSLFHASVAFTFAGVPLAPVAPDPSPSDALSAGLVDPPAAALVDPDALSSTLASPDAAADSIGSVAAHLLLDHPFSFPSPLPPYTTTIVLAAFLLRLLITLPVSLWAHQREVRQKEIVKPALARFANESKRGLVEGCRKEGYTAEQYQKLHHDRCKQAYKHLLDKHSAAPLPTLLLPPLIQLPLFFSLIYVLRAASSSPVSPLGAELLPVVGGSLLDPDPTNMLPLAVGLLMWANTHLLAVVRRQKDELDPWEDVGRKVLVDHVEVDRPGKTGKKSVKEVVEVETKDGWLERKRGDVLKAFAIGFTALSTFAPACMQVYFITTNLFTLLQTYLLKRSDRSRLLALRARLTADPPKAYKVDPRTLPSGATHVPPLPKGVQGMKKMVGRPAVTSIEVEPVKLAFDVRTGRNWVRVSKERREALEREAKERAAVAESAKPRQGAGRRRG